MLKALFWVVSGELDIVIPIRLGYPLLCGGQARDLDKTLPADKWRREASASGWRSRDATQNHLFLSLTAFEFVVAPDVGTVEVSGCLFFGFHLVAWVSY